MKLHYFCIAVLAVIRFSAKAQEPSFFKWDTSKGRIPVTNTRFNTDSNLVQFAILSDRTGGMVPGIFEDAVKKANLLQPQFILSVGDLINGYSTDSVLINAQWKEFTNLLEPLTVPFFYVPGNHDISNSWMQQEWKRRYGQSHYYFVYKNVLFLSLNSQDEGDYGMKAEQVAYFQQILQQFPAVRWTFVFMHQPLWAKTGTGFEKIEAALANRNYTVFAGHTHNYLLSERNKRKYYILATSGGGSERRGEQFGEFDHITWVSFQSAEPKVVHLKLDGLVEENIVDEALRKKIRPLTSGNWLRLKPAQTRSSVESLIQASVQLRNPGELPLAVKGNLPKLTGWHTEPETIQLTLGPGEEKEIPFLLKTLHGQPVDLATLDPVTIELEGAYNINNKRYALPASQRMLLNWPGSTGQEILVHYPEYVTEAWDWQGTGDSFIRFKLHEETKYLTLSATVTDDQLVLQEGEHRDKLLVYFENKNKVPFLLTVAPDSKKPSFQLTKADGSPYKLALSCTSKVSEKGIEVLIKLPIKEILQPDGSFRMNIGYADQDDATSTEAATIYWKPRWDTEQNYPASGIFRPSR